MGRNTDKLYVTQTEHSGQEGKHGASSGITTRKTGSRTRQLPFIYCALTLQTWEHPVCIVDSDRCATMFDLLAIVPWLQQKGTSPTTGNPFEVKDLVKVTFSKNDEGEFCDPVTMKVFNDHTHLVAIRQSGNVFAYETIERLNFKAKHWRDLVSDESFQRSDIITIQDPHNHVNNTVSESVRQSVMSGSPSSKIVDANIVRENKVQLAKQAIQNLRDQRPFVDPSISSNSVERDAKTALPFNAAHYSTGYTAASFTNSGMAVSTRNDRALLNEEQYLLHPKKIKIKGLCSIKTSLGSLDLELWPEHAPKAVYNFVKLAKSRYYEDVTFHRSIPGFMIQGGDPTGKGTGGMSVFGKDFEDEFSPHRSHDRRGLICMANKGPNTNSSQFFILYDAAKHLDKKHTVFGQVIGELTTLDLMERTPVKGDKPKTPIVIHEVLILLDPFDEFMKKEEHKRAQSSKKREITLDDLTTWSSLPVKRRGTSSAPATEIGSTSVGTYLPNPSDLKSDRSSPAPVRSSDGGSVIERKNKTKPFGDFSGW